jgi:hypothetical protein
MAQTRIRKAPTPSVPIDDGREVVEQQPAAVADRQPQHPAPESNRPGVHAEAGNDPEHPPERVRQRRRSALVFNDPFYVPMDEIPPGLSYEWKRVSNVGQEDPFYIAGMREQGWEPVLASRHPNWVPPGYDQPHIIKGGLMLMERPMELTKEARAENEMLAKKQIREAEQRLGLTGTGEATRALKEVAPRVVKEYMRAVPIETE